MLYPCCNFHILLRDCSPRHTTTNTNTHTQGRAWLVKRETTMGRAVTAIGLGDRGLRAALEQALMTGSTLLIENVGEELDPLLDPVLDQRFVRKVRMRRQYAAS